MKFPSRLAAIAAGLVVAGLTNASNPKNGDLYPGWGDQGSGLYSHALADGDLPNLSWNGPAYARLAVNPYQSVTVAGGVADKTNLDLTKYPTGLLNLTMADGTPKPDFGMGGYLTFYGNNPNGFGAGGFVRGAQDSFLISRNNTSTLCRIDAVTGALKPFQGSQNTCIDTVGIDVEAVGVGTFGRITIAGTLNAAGTKFVSRLNAMGSPDTTFNNGYVSIPLPEGLSEIAIRTIATGKDGSVVVGGYQTLKADGRSYPFVRRFTSGGDYDASWVPESWTFTNFVAGVPNGIFDLLLVDNPNHPEEDVVAVGRQRSGNKYNGFIVKYDGVTAALVSGGVGFPTLVPDMGFSDVARLAQDGSLIAMSNCVTSALVRFHPDGSLAPMFAEGGKRVFGAGESCIQSEPPADQMVITSDAAYVLLSDGTGPSGKIMNIAKVYLGDNDRIFADDFQVLFGD